MSGLILNTPNIKAPEAIKNTIRKVSFNPSSFRTSGSLPRLPQQAQKQKDMMLKNIYKKINQEERQLIRSKAHEEARLQIVQLKGKLRKNASKENIEGIMGEKKSNGYSLLSKVMKVPTETIEIDKKYHKRINMKLTLFDETQSIISEKAAYLQWYDSSKNCRTSSPIYTRINYLLQKVGHEKGKDKISMTELAPLRNSMNSQMIKSNKYRRIERKKTEESEYMKY